MIRFARLALIAFEIAALQFAVVVAGHAQTAPAASAGASPFANRFTAHAPLTRRPDGPTLKATATIVGEIVRVGDLIENAGAAANIPIFRAPDLGETGRVATEQVLEAVLPHEIVNLDTAGLTEVVVTRASRTIAARDIEARILQALTSRQRTTDAGNLSLTFDGEVRPLQVEPGTDLRLVRVSFDPRSGRFDALFERPGGRNLIRYTGVYAETFEAVVLTRALAVGDIVRMSDVAVVRRPRAELAANVVAGAEAAVGMSARRAMRVGDVLRQSDLGRPEVIARNDNVTITYQAAGIALTIRGKALESGSHGDVIQVLNVQSKRSLQATIAGPGHVVVIPTSGVSVNSTSTAARLAAQTTGRVTPDVQPRSSAE